MITHFDMPIMVLPHGAGMTMPAYQHTGDAGLDLRAALPDRPIWIPSGSRHNIPCGICVALPEGMVGLVCSRSGMAAKEGLFVLNAPGIIDSGYRGEIVIILQNVGQAPAHIVHGDRIAQLVCVPFMRANLVMVETLGPTDRAGGFGSTGKS